MGLASLLTAILLVLLVNSVVLPPAQHAAAAARSMGSLRQLMLTNPQDAGGGINSSNSAVLVSKHVLAPDSAFTLAAVAAPIGRGAAPPQRAPPQQAAPPQRAPPQQAAPPQGAPNSRQLLAAHNTSSSLPPSLHAAVDTGARSAVLDRVQTLLVQFDLSQRDVPALLAACQPARHGQSCHNAIWNQSSMAVPSNASAQLLEMLRALVGEEAVTTIRNMRLSTTALEWTAPPGATAVRWTGNTMADVREEAASGGDGNTGEPLAQQFLRLLDERSFERHRLLGDGAHTADTGGVGVDRVPLSRSISFVEMEVGSTAEAGMGRALAGAGTAAGAAMVAAASEDAVAGSGSGVVAGGGGVGAARRAVARLSVTLTTVDTAGAAATLAEALLRGFPASSGDGDDGPRRRPATPGPCGAVLDCIASGLTLRNVSVLSPPLSSSSSATATRRPSVVVPTALLPV
jgi:hypothetical protein